MKVGDKVTLLEAAKDALESLRRSPQSGHRDAAIRKLELAIEEITNRTCKCGARFSNRQQHAKCKRCRKSDVAYTARRRQKIFDLIGVYGNLPRWKIASIMYAQRAAREA